MQECVKTALKKKIVVLVTHQVEFLAEVDNILVMIHKDFLQAQTFCSCERITFDPQYWLK